MHKSPLSLLHWIAILVVLLVATLAIMPRAAGHDGQTVVTCPADALLTPVSIPAPKGPEQGRTGVPLDLPFALAALPFLLPAGIRRPLNRRDRRTLAAIHTLYDGNLVSRANEEAAPIPSGQFRVLDAQGREVGMGNAMAGPDGTPYVAMRANAVTALAATVSPVLTAYANGYPQDAVDDVVNFLAPPVPAPAMFQYGVSSLANDLGEMSKDQIGASGIPSVIQEDPTSLTPGMLLFRGLETPFTEQDRIFAMIPGSSPDKVRTRKTKFLVGTIRRGRAYRTYSAVAATAGSATAVTIYTDENPYKKLRSYLEAAILEAGSPAYVRILMGYSNLSGFMDHPLANGVAAGLHHDVTVGEIASKLGIPAANLMVSWHQITTTAQGKTAAKSVLIGADQMYIFVCRPTPDESDNSWLKMFTLDTGSLYEMYTHFSHPLVEMIGSKYWEKLINTNTNTSAVKRLALTFASTATPT